MFDTGFITLFVFATIAVLVDRAKPYNKISAFLAIISVLPFAVSGLSVVVWLIANALILIWG